MRDKLKDIIYELNVEPDEVDVHVDAILSLLDEQRDAIDYKELLYKAYHKFRHKDLLKCTTWYDGCNCIIPYDEFDNEYMKKIIELLKGEK